MMVIRVTNYRLSLVLVEVYCVPDPDIRYGRLDHSCRGLASDALEGGGRIEVHGNRQSHTQPKRND